jgi:dTDP-glucose 4,6-dehydratase
MRVLVTGGAGFIGSNLVRKLVHLGHQVLNVDKLTYAGNVQSLLDLKECDNYQLLVADIVDAQAMESAINGFQPEWIAHLAAESHVDRSIEGPDSFVRTNVLGTYTLLQAVRQYYQSLNEPQRSKFRFLHVSTDEVFGSAGPNDKFCESTPYDPHSPYSASKASSDHLVRAWHSTYGLPVLISNCSNNYGPFQFPEKLVPVVILNAIRGQTIPVYGKGENVRDWIYVDDHCNALELILKNGCVGETYAIGGNNERRNIDLVIQLCNILDRLSPRADGISYETQIQFVTDRPGHDLRNAIDASKITRSLGWQPMEDLRSGFEKTVRWYLENKSWWSSILTGEYRVQLQAGAQTC